MKNLFNPFTDFDEKMRLFKEGMKQNARARRMKEPMPEFKSPLLGKALQQSEPNNSLLNNKDDE